MKLKKRYNAPIQAIQAKSTTQTTDKTIINNIVAEFQDRTRKDIQKWRKAMVAAEAPEGPRWAFMQDLIDDITIDAHVESVLYIRKAATLNHRFYVADITTGDQLDEQNLLLNKRWFYNFLDACLDALIHKYNVVQLIQENENITVVEVPFRNVSINEQKMYLEAFGDKYINYMEVPNVIEINHNSKFGIVNSVIPNVIWKRNAMQAWAEYSEKFGMPLITATTTNRSDIKRIESMLRQLGEAAQAVMPYGTDIKVHDLANAGNPVNTYENQIRLHDEQISKPIVGSSTLIDAATNRSQSEVHERTLDDKIAVQDKRFISFIINDQLFPVLQAMGLPFDNQKMKFVFDETESMKLLEHWKMVNEASQTYEIDPDWVASTFNLPITGVKSPTTPKGETSPKAKGLFGNFQ
jgi:phage gp29-like protein